MKTQRILFPIIMCTAAMGLLSGNNRVCAAEETVTQDTVSSDGQTTTYNSSTKKEKVPKKHHDGLVGDTVGVTGKAVKTTVEMPGKVAKETLKVLF